MANMRLSYWLGKVRRYGPLLFIIVILLIVYKFKSEDTARELERSDWRHKETEPTELPKPSRWLVVHSEVTSVCNHLAAEFQGWNILITGVNKSSDYSHSRCRFIKKKAGGGVDLAYGYLYAIQNKAKFIYVPPSDKKLASLSEPPQLQTRSIHEGLFLDPPPGQHAEFNPNIHWGANVSLPSNASNYEHYKYCKHRVPIIQSQVKVGPITKIALPADSHLNPSSVPYFDRRAPPVTLGAGFYSNISHTGTLYHKDAFWALPLVTIPAEWREMFSLFIQKMLWHSGHNLYTFAEETTSEESSVDGHRAWAQKLLSGHVCESDQLIVCSKKIISNMVKMGFLTAEVQRQVLRWFDTLQSISYTAPLLKFGLDQTRNIHCMEDPVIFFPVQHRKNIVTSIKSHKPFVPVTNSEAIVTYYQELCKSRTPKPSALGSSGAVNFDKPWVQMDHILLIVIYNNPHYETIPIIESMYRSIFPNILYCGPGLPKTSVFKSLKKYQYSFLSYHSTPKGHTAGAFNYNCTSMAINLQYNVDGYLTIADDLLLHVHSIQKLHTHAVWYIPQKEIRIGEILKLRECKLGMCDFHPHWHWWDDYQNQSISVMNYIKTNRLKNTLLYRCHSEIKRLNGADYRPNGGYSDIFYIPRRRARDFVELSSVFLEHEVFLEIAVATIIRCLEAPEDIQPLPGVEIWDESRETPWSYYKRTKLAGKTFLHPTKWGFLARGSDEYADFLCKQVIPHIHDKYNRINDFGA